MSERDWQSTISVCRTVISTYDGRLFLSTLRACHDRDFLELAKNGPTAQVRSWAGALLQRTLHHPPSFCKKLLEEATRILPLALESLIAPNETEAMSLYQLCYAHREFLHLKGEYQKYRRRLSDRVRQHAANAPWDSVYAARLCLECGEAIRRGSHGGHLNSPVRALQSQRHYLKALHHASKLKGDLACPGIEFSASLDLWFAAVDAGQWESADERWNDLFSRYGSTTLLSNPAHEYFEFAAHATKAICSERLSADAAQTLRSLLGPTRCPVDPRL